MELLWFFNPSLGADTDSIPVWYARQNFTTPHAWTAIVTNVRLTRCSAGYR